MHRPTPKIEPWLAAGLCGSAIVATAPCGFAAQYLDTNQALRLCFPSAASFEPRAISGGATRCWDARGPSGLLGHAFLDAVIGKHLLIDYMLAVDPAGKILHLEILAYRESYGGEIRGAAWRKQFQGHGPSKPPRFQKDVVNIGGATLSCRHITEGVSRLLRLFAERIVPR
ncbi:MAG TPA: FMN-binding protein [Verrucomicrobiae bacterium]|nr:FMN-binding protein [Verrucomicrobiae bacterium]